MKANQIKLEDISKQDFIEFEKVRYSGKSNMMDINMVYRLSKHKLIPDKVMAIIEFYDTLNKKYPDVRNND